MAKQVKQTIKKKINQKKRKIQRSKPYQILIFLLVIAVGVYLFFNQEEPSVPNYSVNQNSEGFYYYTSVPSSDYYADANDLEGQALLLELRSIINQGVELQRYADAKEVLALSDLSIDDPTKVYNVYDGVLVPSIWDSTSWHREHVWPNSRLGMDRVTESGRNQASDLHNLRAITPSVNSSRSDRFYSDGSGIEDITEDGGYYPGDDHRGDVARILFYMYTMYDFLELTDEGLEDESNHYTLEGTKMGKLSLLLTWHKEDPVDAFEINRNQAIYEAQGNRNPYIDQPAYVHLIFEDMTIESLLEPEEETETHAYQSFLILIEKRRLFTYVYEI